MRFAAVLGAYEIAAVCPYVKDNLASVVAGIVGIVTVVAGKAAVEHSVNAKAAKPAEPAP